MKKLYALGSLVVPLFLAAAWMGARTVEEAPPQELTAFPGYSLESQHFAMDDLGSLLERIGRGIQQDEQITIGGNSYPVSGFGGMEINVGRRTRGEEESTGVELRFNSAGRTTPPTGRAERPRQDYDPYQRSGRGWEASAVGDIIAELGETLAGTGTIVLEHHSVPFRGAASIDQRLVERTSGRRQPYELEVHVLFGEGEFGFDADEIVWESDELETGRYKFTVKVKDMFGNLDAGPVEEKEITVIRKARPAEMLDIKSYDSQQNILTLEIN